MTVYVMCESWVRGCQVGTVRVLQIPALMPRLCVQNHQDNEQGRHHASHGYGG